jgi:hypothetical protein
LGSSGVLSLVKKQQNEAIVRHRRAKPDTPRGRRARQLSLELEEKKRLRARSKKELIRILSGNAEMDGKCESGVFFPSPKQRALVRALAEFDASSLTITQICKLAGISREAYYNWREKPGFIQWFHSYRKMLFDADVLFIDKVVVNKAMAGDLSAARIVYEKRGEMYKRAEPEEQTKRYPVVSPEEVIRLFTYTQRILEPELRARGLWHGPNSDQPPSAPESEHPAE